MQNPSLPALTSWLATHSAGVSPLSYMMPLSQESQNSPEPIGVDWGILFPSGGFQWLLSDGSPDGAIQINTTVDVMGVLPPDLKLNTVCKMICIYLVSHLNQKSLIEACESLGDIYASQREAENYIPYEPRPEYLGTFAPDKLGRQALHHRDR